MWRSIDVLMLFNANKSANYHKKQLKNLAHSSECKLRSGFLLFLRGFINYARIRRMADTLSTLPRTRVLFIYWAPLQTCWLNTPLQVSAHQEEKGKLRKEPPGEPSHLHFLSMMVRNVFKKFFVNFLQMNKVCVICGDECLIYSLSPFLSSVTTSAVLPIGHREAVESV